MQKTAPKQSKGGNRRTFPAISLANKPCGLTKTEFAFAHEVIFEV